MVSALLVVLTTLAAGGKMYMYIDENGVPVVTDHPTDKRAVRYEPGDFERIAMGQKGVPHRGRASDAPFGGTGVAPRVPPDVGALVARACSKHDVPAPLLLAVIAIESGFDAHAVSSAGAQGLMQLMPPTAKDLGVSDPFDAEQNFLGGARYLAFLLKHFGDQELAVAAYNAGPGRVTRAGNQVPDIPETRAYVTAVLGLAAAYENAPPAGISR